MPPLARVVLGFLLVLLDFRIDGLDLLPDLVGWVVVLTGLAPLSSRHFGFVVAAVAAGAELVLSLFELTSPAGTVLSVLEVLATTTVIVATCVAVAGVVAEPHTQERSQQVRTANLVMGLVALAFVLIGATGTEVDLPGGLILLLALAGLGVVIWFLVFCWQQREEPALR